MVGLTVVGLNFSCEGNETATKALDLAENEQAPRLSFEVETDLMKGFRTGSSVTIDVTVRNSGLSDAEGVRATLDGARCAGAESIPSDSHERYECRVALPEGRSGGSTELRFGVERQGAAAATSGPVVVPLLPIECPNRADVPDDFASPGNRELDSETLQHQLRQTLAALWSDESCERTLATTELQALERACVEVDGIPICWSTTTDGQVDSVWARPPVTKADDLRILLAHALIDDPTTATAAENAEAWNMGEASCDKSTGFGVDLLEVLRGVDVTLTVSACRPAP
jgi:hypothetical protein